MQIIDNANSLLNAIKNNSYLTINDDGQIVKQSTFKGILRKIGDFFKNNFGGGKAVTERQEKLSTAMYQMLSKSDLSYKDYDGIRNSVIKSFENSELKLTATKISAMSQLNKIDPELREFVKGAIADLDKTLKSKDTSLNSEKYCTLLDNIMHTMSNVFKDIDANNPEIQNLKNVIKNLLQDTCKKVVSEDEKHDFSDQFERDISRNSFNVNGKISILKEGFKNTEGIKNELKALFPNQKTRLFVSELLSQTTGNSTSNILMNSDRKPDGTIDYLHAKVPNSFIGNFNLAMSLEEDDEPIDPNKPIYCLTAKGGAIESGSTLEVKKDNEGKIIGATIIRDQSFTLKANQYSSVLSYGEFLFSTKIELDLRDPDNPQILDVDMRYGGNKMGTDFGKIIEAANK